ncbi:DnaA regulatory inactivator Hda [Methylomicrobium lacus]|uniref:DnaA regulatory inactivator Hda n=1 Tax=Methylomicrobium lacus TaxID=136992 RepID=UPI0035A9AD49
MAKQLPLQFVFRANQTFQDFFPGANSAVLNHLQRCVAGSGETFIFLWGQSGLGKSHLLQACCHEAQKLGLSSFYFDLQQAAGASAELLNGLEALELVCLDNVEKMEGLANWELALFNFFNRHRDLGHRLIISSNVGPKALAIELPDLKTRLNWGLALHIATPDDKGRIAALEYKARRMGLEISPQAGRFLLNRADRDMASLWRLLDNLDQASLSAKRKLTIPFLKQILDENPS